MAQLWLAQHYSNFFSETLNTSNIKEKLSLLSRLKTTPLQAMRQTSYPPPLYNPIPFLIHPIQISNSNSFNSIHSLFLLFHTFHSLLLIEKLRDILLPLFILIFPILHLSHLNPRTTNQPFSLPSKICFTYCNQTISPPNPKSRSSRLNLTLRWIHCSNYHRLIIQNTSEGN
jgi:hypothetical protein